MLLDISELKGKIRGVLHIGAYVGEEINLYKELGISNIVFFEPQNFIYEILRRNIGWNARAYNVALGDYNGVATLNISYTEGGIPMGCGASSSILQPKLHLTQHPNVKFHTQEQVSIRKLDDFIEEKEIDITKFNMINIDVQGYELKVFRGAPKVLRCIDYIVSEVNRDEVYEDCAKVEEIDKFLEQYSFMRKETNWAGDIWGDAFYEKDKK